MSESRIRKKKQQKLLDENQDCYFCAGVNPATEIDHVPPKACFPNGYVPEGFEFAACKPCNAGARKQDEVFGLYSMLLDFDQSKMQREEDRRKIAKLREGLINNYPEALPDETKARRISRVGSIITPTPVAVAVPTPQSLKEAAHMMTAKLTHALYFREIGKILTRQHQFYSAVYQPQQGGTEKLTSFFKSLLPNLTVGTRSNVREYGDRFRYISGCKDDLFVYAAQFGHGLILWGVVCGPGLERPKVGPLGSAPWRSGGCGPGADRGKAQTV
jgi:hypothetical protein